jgi:fructose 5-dehydrogenase small subunit
MSWQLHEYDLGAHMTDARESRPSDMPAHSRREFVLGACASAAALSVAATLSLPFGMSPAFAFAPPEGGGFDAFVALSQQLLTGRTSLNPALGKRIYDALTQSDSAFAKNVAALNTWLKTHGGVPSDTVTAAPQAEDPRLAKAVGEVMRAWYLGLVGDMQAVKVVAYESAPMFDPVKDSAAPR